MSRKEIYDEMESMFGLVPSFFKRIPDSTLDLEWSLFKKVEVEKSVIPEKYRELIGIGLSAAIKCKYCTFFHTEMAKLHGATDEEIEDAVHYAKNSAGWSTYINGLQIDYDEFKKEIQEAFEYVKEHREVTT